MKKITILSIALVGLAFASCKKDYTCTCVYTYPGGGSSTDVTKIKGVSKKAATANCASGTSVYSYSGGSSSSTQSCTLAK